MLTLIEIIPDVSVKVSHSDSKVHKLEHFEVDGDVGPDLTDHKVACRRAQHILWVRSYDFHAAAIKKKD